MPGRVQKLHVICILFIATMFITGPVSKWRNCISLPRFDDDVSLIKARIIITLIIVARWCDIAFCMTFRTVLTSMISIYSLISMDNALRSSTTFSSLCSCLLPSLSAAPETSYSHWYVSSAPHKYSGVCYMLVGNWRLLEQHEGCWYIDAIFELFKIPRNCEVGEKRVMRYVVWCRHRVEDCVCWNGWISEDIY